MLRVGEAADQVSHALHAVLYSSAMIAGAQIENPEPWEDRLIDIAEQTLAELRVELGEATQALFDTLEL